MRTDRNNSQADGNRQKKEKLLLQLLLLFMLAGLTMLLIWVYFTPAPAGEGLYELVENNLQNSGVQSKVTAVLLNFRGYDTLLECFVLFLGATGIWALTPHRFNWPQVKGDDSILTSLVQLLAPIMILMAGYLVWAGGNENGGAFQGGALLGGVGVLMLLAARSSLQYLPVSLLRYGLTTGPGIFLFIAVACLLFGGKLLQFPPGYSHRLILLVETATSISIGLALAVLFAGSRPQKLHADRTGKASKDKKTD